MPRDKSKWHPIWKRCHPSWKVQFLDDEFEYKIWYDDELHKIIEESYPQYLEMFNAFPRHILKIDFARFCILHKYGGIYADLDIYCYKNFYKHLKDFDVYLIGSAVPQDRSVENALMISKPNCSFFVECMEETKKQFLNFKNDIDFSKHLNITEFDHKAYTSFIGNTTGIYMVSNIYEKLKNNPSLKIGILNSMLFQPPPSYYDTNLMTKHMCSNWWGNEEIELAEHLFETKYDDVEAKTRDDFVGVFYSRGKLEGLVSIEDFDFYTNYYIEEVTDD